MGRKPRHQKTKQPKLMRVTKSDTKRYEDLLKKVKSKLYRTKKNYGVDPTNTDSDLHLFTVVKPNEITRKMFNNLIAKAESFTNRANTNFQYKKNKHGFVVTKREYNEHKRLDEIQRKRTETRLKKEAKKFKKEKQYEDLILMKSPDEFGKMGKFNFEEIKTRSQWEKRFERAEKRADPNYENKRLLQMRQNYIEKLYDVFNSDADPIVLQIMDMNLDDFYELYKREKRMQFDVVYVEEMMDGVADEYAEEIAYYIERYNEGYYNDGLKNFPDTW